MRACFEGSGRDCSVFFTRSADSLVVGEAFQHSWMALEITLSVWGRGGAGERADTTSIKLC